MNPTTVPAEIADSAGISEVRASVADKVKLPCIVTGSPQPTVRWTHNGNDVVTGGLHIQQLETGLQINSVEADDEGEYVCEVWNGFGQPSLKRFTLIVEGKFVAVIRVEFCGCRIPTFAVARWREEDVILLEQLTLF
jgi:Immunoglobulin I-set domain